jgi:type IV pilus assembly protein PilV
MSHSPNNLPDRDRRILRGQCANRRQSGATLVEVLVSLLIISLGLLGIGGLAASTFSFNKAAQLRMTGTGLVNDYADRARLNVFGYDLGNYAIDYDDEVDAAALDLALLNIDQPDDQVAAGAIAAFDRNDFMNTVAGRLPQGRAVVATDPANGRTMDIWLVWQEPQATAGDALALFQAGQRNCPDDLPAAVVPLASCMYFKVNL